MKIDCLYEQLVYRGIGAGSNSRTIRWVTTSQSYAKGYANYRSNRGKLVELEYSPKNPADLGRDKLRLSVGNFIAMVVPKAKNKGKDVIPVMNKFREHFGDGMRDIVDFWATEADKSITAEFLKALGYDAIKIEEDGNLVYGILR